MSSRWDGFFSPLVLSAMKDSLARTTPPLRLPALHNLNAFADLATVALACLATGAALGVALAVYLRRRDLAWTWGMIGLAPVGLAAALVGVEALGARAAIPPIAFCLGTASASIGWGLYWQLEDRRAGGDRESRGAERRGVFDGARRQVRERAPRRARALAEGLPVGRTPRGELALLRRGSAGSGSHVLIPGATGAGKSTSLAALLVEYVARSGFGAVVLEAKVDRALQDAAMRAAAARDVAFHLVSPNGPAGYDPLAHGSVDERSERLIAVESWGSADADFYRQAASPFLRLVLRTLDRGEERVTLAAVAHCCDPDELNNLAMQTENVDLVGEINATIAGLRADERRAIAGMRARLRNLTSSDFARAWLDPSRAGASGFDLREAIRRREVVYFRFDTDRTGNVGRAIAQMVLLDLGATASALMGEGVGTFVGIDEFGALEAPALHRLYARGRAAGFSVAVGTQTLADLRAAGPAVLERIGATVESIVCHRIGEQADAEWVAQLIGAVPAWQSTIRTNRLGLPTDEGTRTRGYRYEVNPSQLQRLGEGEVYVARLDQTRRSRSTRARVVPAWERLPERAEAA
jgi:hypothetical protein